MTVLMILVSEGWMAPLTAYLMACADVVTRTTSCWRKAGGLPRRWYPMFLVLAACIGYVVA